MEHKTTILIADDHALVRKGLRQVLEVQSQFTIIEVENGEEAIRNIRSKKPDIAILDIEMPKMTGFDVALRVKNESLSVNIIFLTMYKDESVFNKAMDIGVKGYVLKENTVSEIMQCLELVLQGKYYLSPSISEFLVRRGAKLSGSASSSEGLNLLTPAEKNILRLIATMKTNKEIAEELFISIKTVQNHRNNICEKLQLHGAYALLKFAVEHASQF